MDSHLQATIKDIVNTTPIVDMHTHLFPPPFSDLCLTGIDELLTYHYLVSEAFLWMKEDYENFFHRSKTSQAQVVWDELFVKRSPTSEAALGILTILQELEIPFTTNLEEIRNRFQDLSISNSDYADYILEKSNISSITMTNNPFDPLERKYWDKPQPFSRNTFTPALRVDPLISQWKETCRQLVEEGYEVTEDLSSETVKEIKRFLRVWVEKMEPVYMAASLPWNFPTASNESVLLEECVLAVCQEYRLPLSLMLGTKRRLNPQLDIAGDGVGQTNFDYLEKLCVQHPAQKFLLTILSRENQYELTVLGQKFRNVMVFGCWWFLNTPQFMTEMTTMRMDQLGQRFIPQHSDCRVLEQLLYKWKHFRKVFSSILIDRYQLLEEKGVPLTADVIQQDVNQLFRDNFQEFIQEK
ncbi:glucuronate isomerase [Alteribacillus sp. HJP-4]|uniref:glucuronate isomerase n=1 Tax=Alteribacillus sp. HJP-4 TaxID=2775394 RepID=UPI0035CCE647